MFHAADLQSVQLRRWTAPAADDIAQEKGKCGDMTAVERERYYNQRLRACDLEAWFEDLQAYTFPAKFIPLSRDDASALMAWHWHLKRGQDVAMEVEERIVDLTAQIHEASGSFGKSAEAGEVGEVEEPGAFPPVFVKLSCRSPKDAASRQVQARQLAKQRLLQWREDHTGALPDANTLADAIYAGAVGCLRCDSAHEVVETLCTSERVCEDDIPLALSHDKWSQHIVLRPWADIRTEQEFRAFVIGGRITAVCQYFSSVFYPAIAERKDEIRALISNFFEQIRDKVPIRTPADYVIDLAVNVDEGVCNIIEFNPFGEEEDGMGTGTIMFDTDKQVDRAIIFGRLEEGSGAGVGDVRHSGECRGEDVDGGFVLRVVEGPVQGAEARIRGEWRRFLCDEGFLFESP